MVSKDLHLDVTKGKTTIAFLPYVLQWKENGIGKLLNTSFYGTRFLPTSF